MENTTTDISRGKLLRARLLELARHQEELAADEAGGTPYWMPQPTSVHAHRAAADVLRAEADLFIAVDSSAHSPGPLDTIGRAS